MKRTEIINGIIKERGYTSYLEIGLGNFDNFKNIKSDLKYGVDPEFKNGIGVYGITSDEFFKTNDNQLKFDLIFIDGLHHADQVELDIVNAWNCLNKGGLILIHDVRPMDFNTQVVPRKQVQWTGDVWRAWHGLKNTYPKLKTYFIEERAGIGAIEKTRHKIELGFVDNETEWKDYNSLKGWE